MGGVGLDRYRDDTGQSGVRTTGTHDPARAYSSLAGDPAPLPLSAGKPDNKRRQAGAYKGLPLARKSRMEM